MSSEIEAHDDLEDASDQSDRSWDGQSTNTPAEELPTIPQGLAPTDLTSLPAVSRTIITWLARRKTASLEEIEGALNGERDSVLTSLEELIVKGYIKELRIEGVRYYRVVFHTRPRRRLQGLGKELWDRLELDGDQPAEE